MQSIQARALHHRYQCRIAPGSRSVPASAMKTHRAGQFAGYTAPAQIGFRHRARDGLGLIPDPVGLRSPALGFGLCFAFALGECCRVRGRIAP